MHICCCMHIGTCICERSHWCTARCGAGASCTARCARPTGQGEREKPCKLNRPELVSTVCQGRHGCHLTGQ
eukprot:360341-Chlamydomonas_euryale.AAC.10